MSPSLLPVPTEHMPVPIEVEQDEIIPAPSHPLQQPSLPQAEEQGQMPVPTEVEEDEIAPAHLQSPQDQPEQPQQPQQQLHMTILQFTGRPDPGPNGVYYA